MTDFSVFSLPNPWDKETHKVWLASTLQLSRNFSGFNFPHKLSKEQRSQIVALATENLQTNPELSSPKFFSSKKMTPIEKEYLLEHFLVADGFHHTHEGEGFAIDQSGEFLGVINLQNHLQLTLLDTTQEIEKTLNKLIKIESTIGEKVGFAYNDRFGFLTSDPKTAGTALKVTLFLHIPAVIHSGELTELLEREKEDEISAVGLQGNIREMIGDILVAQNICTLGLTEEYILTTMRMWATRAIIGEISLRKKLMQGENEKIKNKVTRALGLLTHSYQLETLEALNAVSLVKLGIDIGWILPKEEINITKVLFDCRRAHLLHQVGLETKIPDLSRKRAEYLHMISQNLQLSL